MKIAITNDHGGIKLKNKLKKYLTKKGYEVLDLGCQTEQSVDYPIYAIELSEKIVNQEADFGIAICKSGIGMSIACNKVNGIRCAKPGSVKEAKLSRLHNNSNIIALGSMVPTYKNMDMVDAFLTTSFSNEERHIKRIDEISEYEEKTKKQTKKIKQLKDNEAQDE